MTRRHGGQGARRAELLRDPELFFELLREEINAPLRRELVAQPDDGSALKPSAEFARLLLKPSA